MPHLTVLLDQLTNQLTDSSQRGLVLRQKKLHRIYLWFFIPTSSWNLLSPRHLRDWNTLEEKGRLLDFQVTGWRTEEQG